MTSPTKTTPKKGDFVIVRSWRGWAVRQVLAAGKKVKTTTGYSLENYDKIKAVLLSEKAANILCEEMNTIENKWNDGPIARIKNDLQMALDAMQAEVGDAVRRSQ